jgi:hypothetical protein
MKRAADGHALMAAIQRFEKQAVLRTENIDFRRDIDRLDRELSVGFETPQGYR